MAIDDPDKYSNRFLVDNRTRPAGCQACHVGINGIGFSLDFYDSLGRHRTEEIRYAANGTVANTFPMVEDISILIMGGRPKVVGGPLTLAKEIAQSEVASACFVSQWSSFTTQSDKYSTASCAKRSLHHNVKAGGAGILQMIRQGARLELDAVKNLKQTP